MNSIVISGPALIFAPGTSLSTALPSSTLCTPCRRVEDRVVDRQLIELQIEQRDAAAVDPRAAGLHDLA